jgi:hypothetical protein
MGDRVIAVANPADPTGEGLVCVRTFPGEGDSADLIASAVVPRGSDPAPAIEASLRNLLPLSEDTLTHCPTGTRRWDHDRDIGDPADGGGWPREIELRISTRPNVYALDRRAVASLGFEGDLLLGWRAGETIATELA